MDISIETLLAIIGDKEVVIWQLRKTITELQAKLGLDTTPIQPEH